jgi:hypothetical protein
LTVADAVSVNFLAFNSAFKLAEMFLLFRSASNLASRLQKPLWRTTVAIQLVIALFLVSVFDLGIVVDDRDVFLGFQS